MKTNKLKLLSCVLAVSVMASGSVASAQISKRESTLDVNDVATATLRDDAETKQEGQHEKGRNIFESVHFMVGEKADELTLVKEIQNSPGFDHDANAYFAKETMDAIQSEDPEYFTRYAEKMTSGNPVVVEAAIADGQDDIKRYIAQQYPEKAEAAEVRPQVCTIGVGGCVWTVALAVNYGAVVNIGGAVMVYTALWGPDKTWSPRAEKESKLQRQTTIVALTQELESK